MRIRHIKTDKEGEPMANPEMEYPTLYFISGGHEVARTDLDEALAKYHSGLLPFEDRELALMCVPSKNRIYSHGQIAGYSVKPDTLIPVDLEVEVVTQHKSVKIYDDDVVKWMDIPTQWMNEFPKDFKYRKVLRIKP